ncbi:GNAT family N-acetyltransferase [Ciceribacter sp. L1K23]|uniref:GNAT family N-acetyltransferase n=1 Tax=unclassified Ciceribacter TaxID=2628820 RepID=UPI001ABE4D1C|nr:GNAT family N-acetyltransferase [Ciceribacter sp. L1K22]MBR0555969.1 GNAT family N-acetyltransferase [Ciceribacter sp. L1K23]
MFFVRTASQQDVEALRTLLSETFHATYDGFYGLLKVQQLIDSWHSVAALKARVDKRDAEFLVADDGKRLGGMAYAAMSPKLTKTAVLHQLYIHPECQRQGIGRDLFAEIESCFPDAEIMRLEVEPRNAGAIAFYQAHGFIEVDRIDSCGSPDSGLPAIVMEKPLG